MKDNKTTVGTMETRGITDVVPSITLKSGRTTYVVGLYFSKTSKETVEDKVKKMLRNEVVRNSS